MIKTFKRTLAVLLAIVLTVGAAPLSGLVGFKLPDIVSLFSVKAEAATSGIFGNLTWSFEENTGTLIIGGTGVMEDFNVYQNGGWRRPWEYLCEDIEIVVIEDGVTTIGYNAFTDCPNLTCINISDSVSKMGWETIAPFYDTTSLTSIEVSLGNAYFCSVDGVLFNKDKTELIQYPAANSRTSYSIPKGVTTLGDGAFYNCDSLVNITMSENLITIGSYAFYECVSLENIIVPDNVISIGESAFYGCVSIENVEFGNSVTLIDRDAFYGCISISSLEIPDNVSEVGWRAFTNCSSLESVYIGKGMESLGVGVFAGCSSLKRIEVSSDNAYYSSEEEILYNKDKTELVCFPASKNIDNYVISESVTKIGQYAFFGALFIKTIIMDSVTSVGDFAFCECTNLEYVHISAEVTSIGYAIVIDSYENISAYICSDTADCYAKEYAEANGIEFVLCEGHEEHSHSYSSSITTEPTCTEEGIKTYICECEDTYTEPIPATGHVAGEWETITEPTVTIEGEKIKKCTVCGKTVEAEKIPIVTQYTITFFLNGVSIYTVSYQEGEAIDFSDIPVEPFKEGYTFNEWKDKNGNSFGYYITMPGENLEYQAIFTVNKYIVTFDANCGKFIDASEIKTYEIEYGTEIVLPDNPTCDGYCFIGYTPSNIPETMPARNLTFTAVWEEIEIGHTHTPKTITIAASCTAAGAEYQVCKECGEPMGEVTVIPSTGHTPGDWETIVEASCTSDGSKVKKCTICSKTVEINVIPAKGHTEGEWEVALEATSTSEGQRIKKCTVCSEVLDVEVIPMIEMVTVSDENTDISLTFPKNDYVGEVDVIVKESFDGAAFNLIDTKTNSTKSFVYDITMTVDGVETQPNGKITIKIPLPNEYDATRTFVYYVDTVSGKVEKMSAVYKDGYMIFETNHFSYYALVEEYTCTTVIRKPSATTISYGDSIILHADVNEALPSGWKIKWTADSGNFSFSSSADGSTCTITPNKSGDTTFTVTVYDEKGNVVSEDTQTMTSKAGFFDKLIAFFKKLFGLTKVIQQSINF